MIHLFLGALGVLGERNFFRLVVFHAKPAEDAKGCKDGFWGLWSGSSLVAFSGL